MTRLLQVPITRISISRKTGAVLSKSVVGYREMSREAYADSLVLALTGMSTEQAATRFLEMQEEGSGARVDKQYPSN